MLLLPSGLTLEGPSRFESAVAGTKSSSLITIKVHLRSVTFAKNQSDHETHKEGDRELRVLESQCTDS